MSKEPSTTLKRAYCKYCKTDNDLNRIFLVNPDADICYCPSCMAKHKPKEAIEEYNYFISQKIVHADRLLYQDTKFNDAYNSFGRVIEIDADSCRARFGRILTLIYMSKLRKAFFIDAGLLLKTEADKYFHKMKDQLFYARSLHKANNAIAEYQKRYIKRLTVKERFYSADCVKVYFQRLHGVIFLRQIIVDELNRIFSKLQDDKIGHLADDIQKQLNRDNRLFKEKVITTEGTAYRVEKIISDRQLLIRAVDERHQPLSHFVKYKLDENERKGRLISDKVYPDNSHIRALIRTMIPIFIFFFLLGVCAGVSYFFIEERFKLYAMFAAAGSAGLMLISLLISIIGKIQLTKRRHLID